MVRPDKARVIDAFARRLREELAAAAAIAAAARDEATSAESRPENQYDTRALEASYLAAGQGERLEALRWLLDWFGALDRSARHASGAEGALLSVRVDGRQRWVLLGPRGGPEVSVDGATVFLVSTASPLGALLAGLGEGDGGEMEAPRGAQEVEVLEVR